MNFEYNLISFFTLFRCSSVMMHLRFNVLLQSTPFPNPTILKLRTTSFIDTLEIFTSSCKAWFDLNFECIIIALVRLLLSVRLRDTLLRREQLPSEFYTQGFSGQLGATYFQWVSLRGDIEKNIFRYVVVLYMRLHAAISAYL